MTGEGSLLLVSWVTRIEQYPKLGDNDVTMDARITIGLAWRATRVERWLMDSMNGPSLALQAARVPAKRYRRTFREFLMSVTFC